MSDRVNNEELALAMPGAEFYCLPVIVCLKGKCVRAIATDVPKDHRLSNHGKFYNHLDLYPAMAERLGITGLQWGDLRVYIEGK